MSPSTTTPRHVSFVETGRSRPGRDLVTRLTEVLSVPVAERNALYAAAGFAPAHPELQLGTEAMASVDRVLAHVLASHEPYPAWVVSQPMTFLTGNAAADRLFPGMTGMSGEQIIDAWFGPGPFRDRVINWSDVVSAGLSALRRDAVASADPAALELLQRAERHAFGIRRVDSKSKPDPADPVVCPIFDFDGTIVRTISAVLRFDTAAEVTASRIRVELMFPADEEAEAFFRAALPVSRLP